MILFQHITAQTTILTPNRRLCAVLGKRYAAWQSEQGKKTWATLDALPLYPSWLERSFHAFYADKLQRHPLLLSTQQELLLWEKILRDAPENEHLLQIQKTAKLAKSAWETLKRWNIALHHPELNLTEDSQAFLQWAETFKKRCHKNHFIDQNSLAHFLTEKITNKEFKAPDHLILIGFTEIAPQYRALLTACENQGSRIEYAVLDIESHISHQTHFNDTETEITSMARWAKAISDESADKTIACIVPDLAAKRDLIERIFTRVFSHEKRFNISAGKPLTSYPIIHAALQCLRFNGRSFTLDEMRFLLHSAFIGMAEEEKSQRALFYEKLCQKNLINFSFTNLLEYHIASHCPALIRYLKQYSLKRKKLPKRLSPSAWVPVFVELLTLAGWPGERSLNSAEYQVVENAWLPLFNLYSSYDTLLSERTYQEALNDLSSMAANTVFQPESPEASIQILGLLEASGLPFDYAWITGMDDTAWPPRPRPNPFIPVQLQKKFHMPNATAERELIYCQELMQQFKKTTKNCIFSYASHQEALELKPSALLKEIPVVETLTFANYISPVERIFASHEIESVLDEYAPALSPDEKISGGASLFKYQAACPFQAFGTIRLHAKPLEDPTTGLSARERGSILHQALESIWKTLQDSKTLHAMTEEELTALIRLHAEKAARRFFPNLNQSKRYFALEVQRLEKIIRQWLEIEKKRPPFKVTAIESAQEVTVSSLTVNIRIDRIDVLENGDELIIDYKTGKNNTASMWFSMRPDEPQLPLYCITNPHLTAGIAFAEIHPDELKWAGISHEDLSIPGIKSLSQLKNADATLWQEQVGLWKRNLTQLADQFYNGHAEVDPKNPKTTCTYCQLKSLCRIYETHHALD